MTRLYLACALVALAIILGPSLHRELVGTDMNTDFITGLATGVVVLAAFTILWLLADRRHRRAPPPSTVRHLPRARRRNRPQLRLLRGIHDHRNWIPVSTDQFDNEPTHPHQRSTP